MTPSALAVGGVALLLGFRHAFEPDHLAAVTTLASRHGRLADACRLGLVWALGHTTSIAVVAIAMIALGVHLPPRLFPVADVLVGLLLIALGGAVIARYLRGRWHMHLHAHDAGPHFHLHSHAHDASHGHDHARPDARRSLGFGLLHGLAGSAAVLLLVVAAAPTRGVQLAYLAAFGGGTALGMLVVTASLAGLVRLATRRGVRWATVLHLSSAAASVVVGVILAARMAGEMLGG
jgi:ABC-type nickel/cobalt efflux system permease component RcnA